MVASNLNVPSSLILLASLIASVLPGYAQESAETLSLMDEMQNKLEISGHQQLLEQKQRSDASLAEFTTDGCSGGLSVGWQYLSDNIEPLKNNHGEHPPWESCCIAHDRVYHEAGERGITAEESLVARREADESLRRCVLGIGTGRVPELSEQYGLSEEEVEFMYQIIADLMYRAVRLGGIPCSGLPWRWGYGWPACE